MFRDFFIKFSKNSKNFRYIRYYLIKKNFLKLKEKHNKDISIHLNICKLLYEKNNQIFWLKKS
jgi:hypothetical protein